MTGSTSISTASISNSAAPIGYFVHHQGRGHAERAAALAHKLVKHRPVTLFSARDDIFSELPNDATVVKIPSLFEADGTAPAGMANLPTPDTLHCAPVGWHSITQAVATLATWFAAARPALFITDVSAELGQLARIASVPHLAVLQHGDRDDPGHMACYRGAAALLAPYHPALEQAERPEWMRAKTIYAPGIGVDRTNIATKESAREKLGLDPDMPLVVIVGGGGGTGLPSASLCLGARADSNSQWVTLGTIGSEWHETVPGNLRHLGWVDDADLWIAAADRIVSSCGNTTVHQVASAAKPWIVVPEWRYFSEQQRKAETLDRAGVAAVAREWPGSAAQWERLWTAAAHIDPEVQRSLVDPKAAATAATAIEALIARLWSKSSEPVGQYHNAQAGL